MTTFSAPLCYYCRHVDRTTWPLSCVAFPEGIPEELLNPLGNGHRVPYPGDHGVQFEPAPGVTPPAISTALGSFDTPEARLMDEVMEQLDQRRVVKRTTKFLFDERGVVIGKEETEEVLPLSDTEEDQ